RCHGNSPRKKTQSDRRAGRDPTSADWRHPLAVGHEAERTRKRGTRATKNGARADGASAREVEYAELEQLLHALESARDGNFTFRLPAAGTGIGADLRRAFNELADRREVFSKEITRVGR